MIPDSRVYLSVKEAAEYLGCDVDKVYHWINTDTGPFCYRFSPPAGRRFSRGDLDMWMKEGRRMEPKSYKQPYRHKESTNECHHRK